MIEQNQDNTTGVEQQQQQPPEFPNETNSISHLLPNPVTNDDELVETKRSDLPVVAIVSSNTSSSTNQNDFANNSSVRSHLLTSPIDSPRHSIILQPPPLQTSQETPIIVGQVSV